MPSSYTPFFGFVPNPSITDRILGELPHPLFGVAAFSLAGSGEGKLSTPFKSVLKFDPNAYEEAQKISDCVSHGTRNAGDISRAVEIDIKGELEGWITRGATEAIYGSRGYGSDGGMTGSQGARYLNKNGITLRKSYLNGKYDLTKYNPNFAVRWGGTGVPLDLIEETKNNRVTTISLATSIEQVRDALANGYGVAVCSNYGFSSTRDSQGFSKKSGSWNHCMSFTAFDDLSPRKGVLVQNSWGKFNGGGHPAWGPIPPGSFLIDVEVAARMVAQQETWIFSNVEGFPPQKLPNYGTEEFL